MIVKIIEGGFEPWVVFFFNFRARLMVYADWRSLNSFFETDT